MIETVTSLDDLQARVNALPSHAFGRLQSATGEEHIRGIVCLVEQNNREMIKSAQQSNSVVWRKAL